MTVAGSLKVAGTRPGAPTCATEQRWGGLVFVRLECDTDVVFVFGFLYRTSFSRVETRSGFCVRASVNNGELQVSLLCP